MCAGFCVALVKNIRALDLQFSAKFRREGEGTQEGKVRLRYLEVGPGLVSGAIVDDAGSIRSVQMRGLAEGDKLTYWVRKNKGKSVTERSPIAERPRISSTLTGSNPSIGVQSTPSSAAAAMAKPSAI